MNRPDCAYCMGGTLGCGTALNLVKFGFMSCPNRMNAPLLPMLQVDTSAIVSTTRSKRASVDQEMAAGRPGHGERKKETEADRTDLSQ